jgi:hypothetical protein
MVHLLAFIKHIKIIDLSGGIQESYSMKKMDCQAQKDEIWKIIVKGRQHHSLMGASMNAYTREPRLPNGLVGGHGNFFSSDL